MLDALREPFELDGTAVHVSATTGIALYPEHGVTVSDLLRHADMAMYQSRRAGRAIGVFDPDPSPGRAPCRPFPGISPAICSSAGPMAAWSR